MKGIILDKGARVLHIVISTFLFKKGWRVKASVIGRWLLPVIGGSKSQRKQRGEVILEIISLAHDLILFPCMMMIWGKLRNKFRLLSDLVIRKLMGILVKG